MPKKKKTAAELFGPFAAVFGLLADAVTLGLFVTGFNAGQSSSFPLWAFLFLSAIYSITLVSFFARKNIYDNSRDEIERLNQLVERERRTEDYRERGVISWADG